MKFQNHILNFDKPKAICPFNFSKVWGNNKISRLYIDQMNFLSYPLLYDHIVTILSVSNRANPDQAALTRAADLCLS